MKRQPIQELVITGNRSPEGVDYILSTLGESPLLPKREHVIIGVQASDEVLYARYRARNREHGDEMVTREDFSTILGDERQRGLQTLFERSDYILSNETDSKHEIKISIQKLFGEHLGFREIPAGGEGNRRMWEGEGYPRGKERF